MTVFVHQADQFGAFDREPPVEGSAWVADGEEYAENPRFLFRGPDLEILRCWRYAQPAGLGGGGLTLTERLSLPAKLLDAFDVLDQCEREWREAHPRG